MKAKIGAVFFRYRNVFGPVLFLLAILIGQPVYPFGSPELKTALEVAGIIVALLGQALRIVTIGYEYIERGGKNRQVYASKLVQGGVFGHCRNPLYLGNILMAVGFALVFNSFVFYLFVIPLILFTYSSIVATEESFLRDKFGEEYKQYCSRVNRWWPKWGGWARSTEDMHFNWNRVVIKEYNTMFLLVAALASLKLWSEYSIGGAGVMPSLNTMLIGAIVWIVLYFGVRSLKKTKIIKA